MSATILIRVAAAIAFIQYTAHTFLFLSAKPTHGQEEVAIVNSMKAKRFDFSGFQRGYWDFYFGYGLLVILWGAIEVVLLWLIGALVAAHPESARPFVALLLIGNIAHAVLAGRYFFLVPVLFDTAVALCLGCALYVL